jgi:hypothetical protein
MLVLVINYGSSPPPRGPTSVLGLVWRSGYTGEIVDTPNLLGADAVLLVEPDEYKNDLNDSQTTLHLNDLT